MAQELEFGDGGAGKIRSFPIGLLLTIITLGIYYFFWYYLLNDELKDIGVAKGDRKLAESSPALSVTAVLVGGWLIVPPLLSIYYGGRVKRAQRIVGVPTSEQISVPVAFLAALFGFLVVPGLFHYWYVTKHQNRARPAGWSCSRCCAAMCRSRGGRCRRSASNARSENRTGKTGACGMARRRGLVEPNRRRDL